MFILLLSWALGLAMVFAGAMHFRAPRAYLRTMPSWLPAPLGLVYLSGVFEVLGGAGLLVPPLRPWAAWGLVALFVAVFPANVNMALHKIPLGRKPMAPWLLWARLPFQLVFIGWAYALT